MIGVSVLSILAASAVLSVQATEAKDFAITYNCTLGAIDINFGNLDSNFTYRAAVGVATTSTSNSTCNATLQEVQNDTLSLTGCISGQLVLYLMEPQGQLENDIGVGKIYTYPIDCEAQSQTVIGNLTVISTATAIPLEPTITLNMGISPNPMYLGQEVNVTITEIGSVKHPLSLTSCIASSSDHNQTVTLVSGGHINQTDLVKNFTSPQNGVVEMTLYGFRFMKDANVELTCTVKVCASSATECQIATTENGRKRGTIPVHSSSASLHIVSGSFRVISDQEPQ